MSTRPTSPEGWTPEQDALDPPRAPRPISGLVEQQRWFKKAHAMLRSEPAEPDVPRISEFFGMTVYMYWFDTQKHQLPHLHVRYQGAEAVFALDGRLLEGDLGARAHRLIEEWCVERAAEIAEAWSRAAIGKEIPWVLPLQ